MVVCISNFPRLNTLRLLMPFLITSANISRSSSACTFHLLYQPIALADGTGLRFLNRYVIVPCHTCLSSVPKKKMTPFRCNLEKKRKISSSAASSSSSISIRHILSLFAQQEIVTDLSNLESINFRLEIKDPRMTSHSSVAVPQRFDSNARLNNDQSTCRLPHSHR